jgi:hypothetical protein
MVLIVMVANTLILLHTLRMAGVRHLILQWRICNSEQRTVKGKEGTAGQIKSIKRGDVDLALWGDQLNKIALEV